MSCAGSGALLAPRTCAGCSGAALGCEITAQKMCRVPWCCVLCSGALESQPRARDSPSSWLCVLTIPLHKPSLFPSWQLPKHSPRRARAAGFPCSPCPFLPSPVLGMNGWDVGAGTGAWLICLPTADPLWVCWADLWKCAVLCPMFWCCLLGLHASCSRTAMLIHCSSEGLAGSSVSSWLTALAAREAGTGGYPKQSHFFPDHQFVL